MWAILAQIALKLIEVFSTWYQKRQVQIRSARYRSKEIQKNIASRARARTQKARDEQSHKDMLRDRALDLLFRDIKLRNKNPSK